MSNGGKTKGVAAAPGIAIGKAFVWEELELKVEKVIMEEPGVEEKRFLEALSLARNNLKSLKSQLEKKLGKDEVEIINAHLMMTEDPELIDGVLQKIKDEKVNAEYAVDKTISSYISMLEGLDDEYLRERAADLRDVGRRILKQLLGVKDASLSEITEECIVVADDLTPSDTAQIDKEQVLGFVTARGGVTSHTAIIARSLGIPAIVGLGSEISEMKEGDLLIVDGDEGEVIIQPDESCLRVYQERQDKIRAYHQNLVALKQKESISKDGKSVIIAANIGEPADAEQAVDSGSDGIGLFRTEFLYMSKDHLPSEEEQFAAYKTVLEKMGNKPVVIRTLDIGGDKNLPYMPLVEEFNPALGYRAIRLCLDQEEIFKTQLRALLRAASYTQASAGLQIMFPMISSLQELREAKRNLVEAKKELSEAKMSYGDVQVGMMIEIPSAALLSEAFAKEVDFFSIGTNDLIQYTLAVDRMNSKVSKLYDQFHPAVLRLIKLTIDNAHKEGKWVGICGEMAGNKELIPVLFGMGVDELSMNSVAVLPARDLIRKLEYKKAKALAEKVVKAATSVEVREYIANF